ncbi:MULTISPECIES: rRNA maturation RNase YbeY [unclassified Bartonella]|uniref:rRNA maturation RNase YbeY n=1 Tax=unclassified Bartonella TaxID=2645622 RepID=UPI001FEECDCD|nr:MULTISPECIES: rRNA maturation RNase YbeY [unclassified Bartonella]UXN03805.1 rRNA maturation RNase YbeY [Bartonella sp. HY406]
MSAVDGDMLKIDIDLVIEDDAWESEPQLLALAQKATYETMLHLGFDDVESELSLVFTNDEAIRAINAQWRNKDKATNVLSFPAFDIAPNEEPDVMLGDIIIARETVEGEAREENKPFDHHLTHLFVHGLLHLLGYDHENDDDAEIMEALEREILAKLQIPDPYRQE